MGSEGLSGFWWSKCDIYVTIEIHSGNVVNVTYTSWFTITGVMP